MLGDVRCPGILPPGHKYAGRPCRQNLGVEIVGLYRADCPKCHREIALWRAGRAVVQDRDGRRVVIEATVTYDDGGPAVPEPETGRLPVPPGDRGAPG